MVEVPGARVPESGETEITSLQRGVVFVFHLIGGESWFNTIHTPEEHVLIIVTIHYSERRPYLNNDYKTTGLSYE